MEKREIRRKLMLFMLSMTRTLNSCTHARSAKRFGNPADKIWVLNGILLA
jgi:hypothetical protein